MPFQGECNLWAFLTYGHFSPGGVTPGYDGVAPLAQQGQNRLRIYVLAINAALQSFQKERSLRFGVREFKRFTELFGGDLQIARAHFEFALHSIE